MILRLSYTVLGIVLGSIATATIYINTFNPLEYWETTKDLGRETAILGCALTKSMSLDQCEVIGDIVKAELDKI